jgi:hypothetical protein
MRTTVTLDSDVVRLLKNEAHQRGASFKVALNEAVRKALVARPPAPRRKPFTIKARPMNLRAGIDPIRLNELSGDLETDAFIAVTERLGKKRR